MKKIFSYILIALLYLVSIAITIAQFLFIKLWVYLYMALKDNHINYKVGVQRGFANARKRTKSFCGTVRCSCGCTEGPINATGPGTLYISVNASEKSHEAQIEIWDFKSKPAQSKMLYLDKNALFHLIAILANARLNLGKKPKKLKLIK